MGKGIDSLYEATDLDIEFHDTLYRISGHKRLMAAWEALKEQARMFLLAHRNLRPKDFEDRAVLWHRRIVGALRHRDVDLACNIMHEHIIVALNTVTEDLFGSSENSAQVGDGSR